MKSAISVSLTSASQISISDQRTPQHDQFLQVSPQASDAWQIHIHQYIYISLSIAVSMSPAGGSIYIYIN